MDNVIKLDFIDELKLEGIKCKGYGVLPKYVMIDPDLTIEAKGIYAYFCSFAGSGNTAFPSRDRIIADLQINKDTYGKHFNVITSQGYITVEQSHAHGGRGNGFAKNIYTLISNPKKFTDKPEDVKHNQAYIRIRFGGLEAAGFGFIPKAVMLDGRLPLKAKAIYAYFCSFAGSGNAAFPSRDKIIFHLGITHNTYQKFYKLLTELNYITAVQRHIDGRLNVNDYYLNTNPDYTKETHKEVSVITLQSTKFSDTQDIDLCLQSTKFSDTQKQDTKKQDTQNSDTNNNNIKTNNFNNNQSINQQAAKPLYPAEPELMDRRSEEYIDFIKKELLDSGTLPYAYMADDDKLTTAIHILTAYDSQLEFYNLHKDEPQVEKRFIAFNLFNEALIEMLTMTDNKMTLKGSVVTYSKVYDKIVGDIEKSDGIYTGEVIYLRDLPDNAISDYLNATKEREITNHLQYMKACIWNALQVGNAPVIAAITRDFG